MSSKHYKSIPAQEKHGHTFQYEFGGPIGTTINVFMLPVATYLIYLLCNEQYQFTFHNILSYQQLNHILNKFVLPNLFSWHACAVYLSWYTLNVVLYYIIPCDKVNGGILYNTNNKSLQYPLNGWWSMWISIIVVVACAAYNIGGLTPTYGYDNFLSLCTSSIIFSFALSLYLYISSHIHTPNQLIDSIDYNQYPTRLLAKHGNSGNLFYDFWIGRTLNPRIMGLDLKYFNELRPGLVLWLLLNLSFAYKQHSTHGLTVSMVLVNVFEAYYVIDAIWSESAILSTMDITTDGFGFMLVFGDLTWVPFIYSLQARYLVFHPVHLSTLAIISIIACKLAGYFIFRGSNNQKNIFRTQPDHPDVRNLDSIATHTGSRLLCSGWWGMARHINYFGDILMGLSWCLPTGTQCPITYFYIIYFIVLLIHRERRDDHKCAQKYGNDWVKYCKLVPYRIVPYIY